jgi:hypothetical protein
MGVTAGAGLAATTESGVAVLNGVTVIHGADKSHTYTASKDTYVTSSRNGRLFTEVANGAAPPARSHDEVLLGKVVSGAAAISSIDTDTNVPKAPLGSQQTIPECSDRNHNFDLNMWSGGADKVPDGWDIV